jgi:hypothetical protein
MIYLLDTNVCRHYRVLGAADLGDTCTVTRRKPRPGFGRGLFMRTEIARF